jgi:hypothetical protein
MSNRRKTKKPRGAGSPDDALRLLGGQGTGASPRQGQLHAVGSQTIVGGKRVAKRPLPALPEAAATSVHVVKVSLHDAFPPIWRRLELPSAMTLDRLHEIVQELFGWNGFHLHVFETAYGEFGSPSWRGSSDRSDEAAVALAQVAGEEGAEMVYVYDFGDGWRHDIVVEKIAPASPGVAYPRCTAGRGTETPDEDSGGIWAFNAQRAEDAADDPALSYSVAEIDAEVETEMLAYLAKVIVPGS